MTRPGWTSLPVWPTRRGVGAFAVLAFAFTMAWQYGLRSLHAIMIPLVVLLLAAVITVARVDEPTVRRHPVDEGFLGEQRSVDVTIDVDRPIPATADDAVGAGITPVDGGNAAETMLRPDGRFSYDVTLDRRGAHRLGPLVITVSDLLGLFRRRFEVDRTTAAVVYPRVYDLRQGDQRDLELLAALEDVTDREEFDHLREYARGDSVRHVHWKSAAKRAGEDLMIKEFEPATERGAATVAAECAPGHDDEMATAAASAVTYLLQVGLAVGLTLPEADHPPAAGRDHHRELLGSLAVVGPGELDAQIRDRADVLVQADPSGTTVVVGDRDIPFERLRGTRVDGDAGRPGRSDRAQMPATNDTHRAWRTDASESVPGDYRGVSSEPAHRDPADRHSRPDDRFRGVRS